MLVGCLCEEALYKGRGAERESEVRRAQVTKRSCFPAAISVVTAIKVCFSVSKGCTCSLLLVVVE